MTPDHISCSFKDKIHKQLEFSECNKVSPHSTLHQLWVTHSPLICFMKLIKCTLSNSTWAIVIIMVWAVWNSSYMGQLLHSVIKGFITHILEAKREWSRRYSNWGPDCSTAKAISGVGQHGPWGRQPPPLWAAHSNSGPPCPPVRGCEGYSRPSHIPGGGPTRWRSGNWNFFEEKACKV